MLDADQISSHLARLEYRPGWRWRVEEDQYEGVYVRILIDVEDTYGSGSTTLGIDSYLSPNDRSSIDALETWMLWRLTRIETHECREFLKRDQVIIFDPHVPSSDWGAA